MTNVTTVAAPPSGEPESQPQRDPNRVVRVLLADDHVLVRTGVRVHLETLPRVKVIAEADDGYEAIARADELLPDLILMDISMPRCSGLDATARISEKYPEIRIVILSIYVTEEYVLQALQSGADGYLLKDTTPEELGVAVEAVLNDRTYISPSVFRHVTEYMARTGDHSRELELLTARQRQVLKLLAQGHSTREIAGILGISPKTVETHKLRLMNRLEIYDLPGLTRFAVRTGLIKLD